jgi:hypothetical protein
MDLLSSRKSALPADWPDVLTKIEEMLAETVAQAADRAGGLDNAPSSPAIDQTPAWQEGVARLEDHLRSFTSCIQQAEQTAGELSAHLQTGEQSLQLWLTAAENVRQRLAKSEFPSVR